MKLNSKFLLPFLVTVILYACSSGKATPESIAQQWCDLNGKVNKAADGPAKEAAKTAREKFETEIETKYKADTAMMNKIKTAVESCAEQSAGR